MALEHRIVMKNGKYEVQQRRLTRWLKRVVEDWYSLGDVYNSWGDMDVRVFNSLDDVRSAINSKKHPFSSLKVGEELPVVEVEIVC